MIKKILVSFIKSIIINNFQEIVTEVKKNEIELIRLRSNFDIHRLVYFSESTNFSIEGLPKSVIFLENVTTRRFCNFLIFNDATLKIGKNVFFNNYCSINCLGNIEIGENSLFGEGVKIYDHNHRYSKNNDQIEIKGNEYSIDRVKIGKNCWIASNVTILKGVTIGDNVIIGANNLIYTSIPSNTVVKANASFTIS